MAITTAARDIDAPAAGAAPAKRIALRDLPLLPLIILVPFVVAALFAELLAPFDPTVPVPGASFFLPPAWMEGSHPDALLGTDFQNRDILQLVVEVDDFGDVRYDGRLDRDGDFRVRQATIFPDAGLRDESTVEGRFSSSGERLTGIEDERIEDLRTGDRCRIVWRWQGRRR